MAHNAIIIITTITIAIMGSIHSCGDHRSPHNRVFGILRMQFDSFNSRRNFEWRQL